jgi:hypothetical protein
MGMAGRRDRGLLSMAKVQEGLPRNLGGPRRSIANISGNGEPSEDRPRTPGQTCIEPARSVWRYEAKAGAVVPRGDGDEASGEGGRAS